jgi:hypothetical protein
VQRQDPNARAVPRRWERRLERGGLFRIVRNRDVAPEAYKEVFTAFLKRPPRPSLRVQPAFLQPAAPADIKRN